MKILLLLFPLLLLLVHGAAGDSNSYCWIYNGFCSSLVCPSGSKVIGRCSANLVCCKK
ncbi:AMP1 protein, partial [Sterrhoptilus dennistouni]|nr:AMP1 protein [Sterrhoptilus dennistouni]